MIDCEQALREIERYVDGELDPAGCREIEQHLGECGPCLQRKEFRSSLRVLVAKKCGPGPAPDALLQRIKKLLASERLE